MSLLLWFLVPWAFCVGYAALITSYRSILRKANVHNHSMFWIFLTAWIMVPSMVLYTLILKFVKWSTDYRDV